MRATVKALLDPTGNRFVAAARARNYVLTPTPSTGYAPAQRWPPTSLRVPRASRTGLSLPSEILQYTTARSAPFTRSRDLGAQLAGLPKFPGCESVVPGAPGSQK
jgi:hypothetical protein